MNTKEFDRVFEEMDQVFGKMDELFDQFDRFAKEAKSVNENVHFENPDERTVRFRARGLKDRARHSWNFFCMTVSMIFRGHATITFRRRKSVK